MAAQAREAIPQGDAKFSVAIPHYNRGRLAHRPLCNLLNHLAVAEVVFFDDGSRPGEIRALQAVVDSLHPQKPMHIRLRPQNCGAFRTKVDAVEAASEDWVLILDSDNTAFKGYLDALARLPALNPQTVYCSPWAFPHFSFHALAGKSLDYDSAAELVRSGFLRRVYFINDGNYLVHRATYLNVLRPYLGIETGAADVMTANYLLLSAGCKLQVLSSGAYHHRIEGSSFWHSTLEHSRPRAMEIFSKFEKGERGGL